MLNKLFVTAFMLSTLIGTTLFVGGAQAQVAVRQKVDICHATNAANNPYRAINVSVSAVDGLGKNDHSHHTGPVFDPDFHNQQNRGWGDIIPPVAGVTPGLNWTAEGQATWDNGCVPVVAEPADIVFEVACTLNEEEENIVRVALFNQGGKTGTILLNGDPIELDALELKNIDFESGTQIVIELDDETVYDQTPVCDEQVPEEPGEVLGTTDSEDDDTTITPLGSVSAGAGGSATSNGVAVAGVVTSSMLLGLGAKVASKSYFL